MGGSTWELKFSLGFQQPERGLRPVPSVSSEQHWCVLRKLMGYSHLQSFLHPINLEDELLVKSGGRMHFPFVSVGWEVIKQDLGMILSAKPRFRQVCTYQRVRNANAPGWVGQEPHVRQLDTYLPLWT